MEKSEVLVVGELNVDIVLNGMASLPESGKEILARDMTVTLGSSSAIFASNLSVLGAEVRFAGKIGDDMFGQLVMDSLRQKGVKTGSIIQSDTLATGATVVLNYGEDRAMVTHPGAMEDFCIKDVSAADISAAKHLHFSSYFLQPGISKDLAQLFGMAKAAGLTTSFDAQCDPLCQWDIDLKSILPHTDFFLPNENELMSLTGAGNAEDGINRIKNFANTIVVKMGNRGSVAWHNGKFIHTPAFVNPQVIDAIGAGDSFNAGFIYKMLQGSPIEECQLFGNLTGAISTTAPGGTTAFVNHDTVMGIAKNRFGYEA